MDILKRFWFRLPETDENAMFRLGCGVTAHDVNDALKLIQEFFPDAIVPENPNYLENIDISTLDQKHVIPNIGISSNRGIWFPKIM